MTEEELIDLGFEQIIVSDQESQNGYDYYFYQKELCDNLVLHSTDSDNVENNNWYLTSHEIPAIRIESKEHFMQFLDIMNLITC